jgi:hypothetical protein
MCEITIELHAHTASTPGVDAVDQCGRRRRDRHVRMVPPLGVTVAAAVRGCGIRICAKSPLNFMLT